MDESRALIIVDVQPTFCEGGALAVEGGNDVAERIADFVTDNSDEYALIVTTQDWHVDPGEHFSSSPDFVDTWPPHGIAGTPEAELHEAIASLPIDAYVKKGEYGAAYSGFEGMDDDDRSLEEILRDADIHSVDIVGLAESHCVKETALDALRRGWPTRVFSDLTVPVSEDLGEAARADMDEAGIEQLTSSQAFGFYEETEDTPIPGDNADTFAGASQTEYRTGLSAYDSDAFDDIDDGYGDHDSEEDEWDQESWEEGQWDDDSHDSSLGDLISRGAMPASLHEYSSDAASRHSSQNQKIPGPHGDGDDVDLSDFDLDDFDLDIEEIDFSDEADEDDFDFSDIDYKPEL